MLVFTIFTGADPGFQVRGGGRTKKIAPNGGRREHFWGISCEKSRFYPKNLIFSNFMGEGTPPGSVPGASIRKLINTDRRKLGINLKEVIDRFIWTIELCYI